MNKKSEIISGMIFSFDRAMQLDAVLHSFFFHCKDPEIVNLTVLFKTSDANNSAQYKILINMYPQVNFVLQNDFRNDVLHWLTSNSTRHSFNLYRSFTSLFLLSRNNKIFRALFNRSIRRLLLNIFPYDPNHLILFLVDDNIFTHDFSLNEIIHQLIDQPEALGFSLRLGKNTTYCYAHSSSQNLPRFEPVSNRILRFDWTKAEHDFGYPLEVSSSVYREKQILPLLLRSIFDNPNSLEGVIASQPFQFSKTFPYLLCYETSVTFCNPINIVQKVVNNRAGNNLIYSANSLSQKFESGERINITAYDNFVSKGCHQEVPLFFLKGTE